MRLKERDITRTVREYLGYRGWSPVRINAGPFGKKGQPDYLFLHYAKRRHLWIEFKSPRGSLSPEQIQWIQIARKDGAQVLVVRDVDEFMGWYEKQFGEEGQMRLKA